LLIDREVVSISGVFRSSRPVPSNSKVTDWLCNQTGLDSRRHLLMVTFYCGIRETLLEMALRHLLDQMPRSCITKTTQFRRLAGLATKSSRQLSATVTFSGSIAQLANHESLRRFNYLNSRVHLNRSMCQTMLLIFRSHHGAIYCLDLRVGKTNGSLGFHEVWRREVVKYHGLVTSFIVDPIMENWMVMC
ncbi:hypothetical protein OSTOST_24921, partial [Ostertagia ostertagi]